MTLRASRLGLCALGFLVACGPTIQGSAVKVVAAAGSASKCVDLVVEAPSGQGAARGLVLKDGVVIIGVSRRGVGAGATVTATGLAADCATPTGEVASGKLEFPEQVLTLELKPKTTASDGGFVDAGADDAGAPDSGVVDTDAGLSDAGTPDAGAPDAGMVDAGTPDAGAPDAGTIDAGTPDAGAPDSGTIDAGTPDAGTPDAGTPDAGRPDAGTPDAGAPDAGPRDAGPPDAGAPDAGPPDSGVDRDNDGSPAGVDCDDNDPNNFPNNVELCFDRQDNNCNMQVDCADLSCGMLRCAPDGGFGAICKQGQCIEETCDDQIDNNANGVADCADMSCVGATCTDGLSCTMGPGVCAAGVCMETSDCLAPLMGACTTLCANTSRNQCLPRVLMGAMCDDNNLCTVPDVCLGDGGCVGTQVTCPMPTNACFESFCVPSDGGCADRVKPLPAACDDGNLCTLNDGCALDGGCVGTVKTCTPAIANGCFDSSCVPSDGGCADRVKPLPAVCDDGNLCTLNDGCAADGGCAGQQRTCPSPAGGCAVGFCVPSDGGCATRALDAGVGCMPDNNVCTDDVCDGLGGCAHPIARFRSCGGIGVCSSTGTCVDGGFPYQVSNVNVEALPTPATPTFGTNCTAVLDTTGTSAVVGGCSLTSAMFPSVVQMQPTGGSPLMVVSLASLNIPSTASLTIVGPKPVAFVVFGSANVQGRIGVSASGAFSGPGAGPCTAGNGANTSGGNPNAGGGGGGFGQDGGMGSRNGTAVTLGGTSEGSVSLIPLRGGCPGGSTTVDGATFIQGGGGGGAFQLSVSGTLTLGALAVLNAAGGGGGGGSFTRGGGGGGSGGALLLEGNNLIITAGAVLAANGGGGGQGDRLTNGGVGSDGQDGQASATPATGGQASCGDLGGNGAAGITFATDGRLKPNGACTSGGGGGGGAAGRIRLNGAVSCSIAGSISPSASQSCP